MLYLVYIINHLIYILGGHVIMLIQIRSRYHGYQNAGRLSRS